MQVHFVNEAIRKAPQGSKLHGLAPIVDPSDDIIEVLLAALRWDMQQRRFGLTAVGLDKLHALSVELLELLKENMPYRTGGPEGWNFEKEHSILHKVRDILLFGWSENFSHQGPEHGHIDNCKKLANCTNNKEVYLTVLRAHSREGHLQYLRSLEADLADAAQDEGEVAEESVAASTIDKEGEAGSCELGIRYPTLQSIYAGKLNKQSIQVHIIYDIIYDIIADITYDIQVQGRKTYAGMTNSPAYHHFTGKECLDVHLLKPARLDVLPGQPDVVCADDGQPAGPAWLEYPFRKSHPIIRWLPSKLAAWIGENFGHELQIPPKRDLKWTAGELNAILENNLVPSHGGKGQLRTFGCIQWECELYSGRPKARCYPFNLKNHRFRGKNRQVLHVI